MTRKTEVTLSQLPTYTAGPLSVGMAKPLVEADQLGRAGLIERRTYVTTGALAPNHDGYDEMRGLRLTAAQAQRLFGLREDIYRRVFNALVDAAILRRDLNNMYARNGPP